MLPSTITLNVGNPAADVVFERASGAVGSNEAIYFAPSPNSDLAGRIKARVSHETTKSGIVKSLVQITEPVIDADGNYSSFISTNHVVNRSSKADLDEVDRVMEMAQEIWAITDFRTDVGGGEV